MNYRPKNNRDNNINSTKAAIRATLMNMPETIDAHKRKLLNIALWMITEVDGKYNVRYVSKGVLETSGKKQLRHEHVYPRKFIIDSLFMNPENYSQIIDEYAIACIVTKEEHDILDNKTDGWERYKRAEIQVVDLIKDNQIQKSDSTLQNIDNFYQQFWVDFANYCVVNNKGYLKGKENHPQKPYNEQNVGGIPAGILRYAYYLRSNGRIHLEIYMKNGMNNGIYNQLRNISDEIENEFPSDDWSPSNNHARFRFSSERTFNISNTKDRTEAMRWFLQHGERMYKFLSDRASLFI